ncbi:MAG: TolC family protein [Zetaproteobacteria bacterium CG12_big_fil_rev_8_21_14_0_65_55_1124]|nr:MAG: transporter [Zetaproteobacteria bacterium CG1_02_55_237]PIS19332.1 MAG: TolC family protein [Zetaproteobacteria bacterium CG08_land_8_20_14_0_20_55_17]PIW42485.1 MAG: TolC family protein [Zetaproteobacteria bacterium CG12_big_fil_rev_8_21_14_0_65_55_1124]PIY51934.1 MAG: TolC family protein [Zetaproteobacteria bacterium CG_4_10_14_0_8_um_filter_55_43]PIZ37549.1 MAG: TolC family protein [Zetaproteobacteria bacterium CG_4_10_14_0_2_um_filter_55_20]PJB79208.1 MAG: TolC family protein [Zeta
MHVPSKKVRQLLAMIVISAGACAAQVQAADAVLSLAQAETLAAQNNPALAAAGKRAEAMSAIPSQVGSLPDPMLSLNAMNLPVDTFSNTQEPMTQMQLGIAQALPFPGKLGLRAEAANRMAEAAVQDRQEFRLLLLRNTRIHWWNLAYLDKALSIIRQNQELLRNLVRIAETKYKTGKGLQQDVLLAQLELSKLLERELELTSSRQRESAALNALLGRPANSSIELPRQDKPDLQDINTDTAALKQQAREMRPMLLAKDYGVQAADSKVDLAERDYYPDFMLGAAYGFRQGSNANGQARPDLASVMLSMSLPLYSGSKQGKAVDQRMAEKASAEFSWRDAANQVDAEIDTAASDLRIARERVQLFEQGILPQARQTTASMQSGYQVNKVDFLNLVRAQLNEFNTDIQYWQQVSALHQAEARLAAAAGLDDLNKEVMHHE